jgi:hypothetical protein
MAAARKIRLDAVDRRPQAQLLEPANLRGGEDLVHHVRGRLAPPERKGRAEGLPCRRGVAGREHPPPVGPETLEPVQVHRLRGRARPVVERMRLDHARRSGAIQQLRDVHLNGVCRRSRRSRVPETIRDLIRPDHLVSAQQKQDEQGALLAAAQRNRMSVANHLERAKHPEVETVVHRRRIGTGTAIEGRRIERPAPLGAACLEPARERVAPAVPAVAGARRRRIHLDRALGDLWSDREEARLDPRVAADRRAAWSPGHRRSRRTSPRWFPPAGTPASRRRPGRTAFRGTGPYRCCRRHRRCRPSPRLPAHPAA